ncbi:uncharacterized protein F4822DRAFT_249536 [Hypoxylon trugodes]|uniref:uncharacterized protein n=1 Tax=Hypoxylon trugodes TaxID=326681 RepID=UPI00219D6971|nr:uncharacterized protein F4822DRAFT_249536 [Hypoxylon trugodes]KAI1388539.1 hypothetical protein F4822DRAFT_249536 [Hypoxylon trugodes]
MYRIPTEQVRATGGGFVPVPQVDASDDHSENEQENSGTPQTRKWTPNDFRSQVQQVLRRQNQEQESVRNSPAFSDTTLVGGDYLDVPLRHYEEEHYVEYLGGYYGPEAANLSPTPSTKAGLEIEVFPVSLGPDLSPGGLCVDDAWNDTSYHGSGGEIDGEQPSTPQNYKPLSLRKRFLITLLSFLIILIVLAELAIQLLPNDSGVAVSSQAYENATKVRLRSILIRRADVFNQSSLRGRQNGTHDVDPVPETTTSTQTASISTPDIIIISTSSAVLTTPSSSSSVEDSSGRDATTGGLSTSSAGTSISISDVTGPPASTASTPSPSSLTTSISQAEPPSTPSSTPPPPTTTTTTSDSQPSSTLIHSSSSSPTSSFSFTLPSPPLSTSSSESLPLTPSETETEEPTSSHSSLFSTAPITSITSTILPPTDGITTTSGPGNPLPGPTSDHLSEPSHPGAPTKPGEQRPPSSSSLPTGGESSFTLSSPTAPTLSWPTHSFSTSLISFPSWPTSLDPTLTGPILTFPTLTLPSLTLPTFTRSSPTISSSSPETSASTSLSFPGSTNSQGSTDNPSSTSENPPGNGQSSTTVSTVTAITLTTSNTLSSTSSGRSDSHTTPTDTPSSTTEDNTSRTAEPPSSISEPAVTITTAPNGWPRPPAITTTIVTSVTESDGGHLETTLRVITYPIKADNNDEMEEWVSRHTDSANSVWTETLLEQKLTETIYTVINGTSTTQTIHKLTPPSKTTLTDFQGRATATEDYYLVQTTEVIRDMYGRPTATLTSMIPETPMVTTLFNSDGIATKTQTKLVPMSVTTTVITVPTPKASPEAENKQLDIEPISNGKYFLGLMLPMFIASMISIPIRMIDQSARLFQPFHALSSSRGVRACDSICFQTANVWSLTARFRSLLNGQVLLTLTGLLALGSVIMIPISSEAVRIILEGPDCAATNADRLTCKMVLGVNSIPAQFCVGLLAFMVVLTIVIIIVLRKYFTGVNCNPWNFFKLGHLAANSEIRTLLLRKLQGKNGQITNKEANKAFAGIPFVIDYWKDNGGLKYGLLIPNQVKLLKKEGKSVTFANKKARPRRTRDSMPFFALTWIGRVLFLALICTTIILLLVFEIAGEGQGYKQFLMGRWRVVRLILVCIGVLITLIWWSFLYAVAFMSPHILLHRIRLYNGEAVRMTPPTDPISGIRSSLTPGRRDIYLGLVSAICILSEILPMLLAVALDKCTESFWAHTVCLWLAVSVLSISMFTVAGSFFVTWPNMPIDPSTVAGGMYYALTKFVSMSPSSGLLLGMV